MTVYAPSDVRSITVPAGCGQPHAAGDLADGERFTVDCPACEPKILGMRTGWAQAAGDVAKTPDEIAAAASEHAEAQRAAAVMLSALTRDMASMPGFLSATPGAGR